MIAMPPGSDNKKKFLTFIPFDIPSPLVEASPVASHAYEIYTAS